MSHSLSQFPKGSLLSQLVMDVYVDKNGVTILYDRPLTQELLSMEYDKKNRELYFTFPPGTLPFGTPLNEDIAEIMETVQTVTLIHIDTNTHEAISGMEVPLTIL